MFTSKFFWEIIGFKSSNLAIDSSYADIILFNVTFITTSLSVYYNNNDNQVTVGMAVLSGRFPSFF